MIASKRIAGPWVTSFATKYPAEQWALEIMDNSVSRKIVPV
jgi:hypothetical protein